MFILYQLSSDNGEVEVLVATDIAGSKIERLVSEAVGYDMTIDQLLAQDDIIARVELDLFSADDLFIRASSIPNLKFNSTRIFDED